MAMLDLLDDEDDRPVDGSRDPTLEFTSSPDGNTVKLQFIRPQSDEPLPCVYYIHGGGMASDVVLRRDVPLVGPHHRQPGRRRGHGRLPQLPEPSSAPEVAPFPAG